MKISNIIIIHVIINDMNDSMGNIILPFNNIYNIIILLYFMSYYDSPACYGTAMTSTEQKMGWLND